MKHILLLIGLCISLIMTARDFTYEGIKYTVIDEANKYVETKAGYTEEIDNETKRYAGNEVAVDNLILPSKVYDGKTEYTLTRIGDISFYGSSIRDLTIPETVKEIGTDAFMISIFLSNINFPKEMTSIGEQAFGGCMSLTEIELPDISTIRPYTFTACLLLENVKIPETVKTIGQGAFSTTGLKSISLPGVRVIDSGAFYVNVLERVELGDALVDIGTQAFGKGSNIKSVYYNTDSPILAWKDIFDDDIYDNATLYVPSSSKGTFEKKRPWYYFANIEEYDFASIDGVYSFNTNKIEYFDLNGNRIENPAPGQIVIECRGNKHTKIVVK